MQSRLPLLVLATSIAVFTSAKGLADEVQPASHTIATVGQLPSEATTVTFAQQPARIGDRVAQTIGVELLINTSITQADQQAHAGKNLMRRQQQRFVEVVEVVDGRVRRAHVSYPISRVVNSQDDEPENEEAQPVEKKSYFVTREGQRLIVTDADGAIPSKAEYEVIVTGLQNFGQPNPLVGHLVGKTYALGQQLQLPRETAELLMGMGGQLGTVEEFTLELKSIRVIDGQSCAVFAATIKAVGEPTNPIRIHAFGQVVVQAETCRTVSAEISGPLTLSVVEKTPQGDYQYKANGNMRLSAKSKYGYAQQ